MTHSALGKHMNGRYPQAPTFWYKTGKFDFEQEQELLTLALNLWSALRPILLLLESFEISAKNIMSTWRLYSLKPRSYLRTHRIHIWTTIDQSPWKDTHERKTLL